MRSMTGYARIEKNVENYAFTVEIKSLNGKRLNTRISLPGIFSQLEIPLQELLKENFPRGSLSVYINIDILSKSDLIKPNLGLAQSYYYALNTLAKELHITDEITLDILTKFRDIFRIELTNEMLEDIWNNLKDIIKEAINKVISDQRKEGEALKSKIVEYIHQLNEIVENIKKNANRMKEYFREKLHENLKSILPDDFELDENRLEMEVALLAERADISEEIDRLVIHINRFMNIVESDSVSKGLDLDFLAQEMHRELNTIAAKSRLKDISNLSIEGRMIVNKIREQIQNVL